MNKRVQLGLKVETNNSNGFSKFNSFLKNTKKFIAFTLAETLIVMGIIGVVAALTIPNLNSSTGNAEKITKLKKVYAELNEAQSRAVAIYGPLATWFINDTTNDQKTKRLADRMTEFMKISKDCGTSSGACFLSSKYENYNGTNGLNGVTFYPGDSVYQQRILASGVSIAFYYMSSYIQIAIDIDGPKKGKNYGGIDYFVFRFDPISGNYKPNYYFDSTKSAITRNGILPVSAATWVLENGNMDYLLADDDFKCKTNGKPLGYGTGQVTSCK